VEAELRLGLSWGLTECLRRLNTVPAISHYPKLFCLMERVAVDNWYLGVLAPSSLNGGAGEQSTGAVSHPVLYTYLGAAEDLNFNRLIFRHKAESATAPQSMRCCDGVPECTGRLLDQANSSETRIFPPFILVPACSKQKSDYFRQQYLSGEKMPEVELRGEDSSF